MKALHLPMKDRTLIDAWNRAVGPQIGAKAQPDRLKDDILYVRVSTSVWMHELQFMKQDIISKLNGILGGTKVAQIRYFIGAVEAPPAKPVGPEGPLASGGITQRVGVLEQFPAEHRQIAGPVGNTLLELSGIAAHFLLQPFALHDFGIQAYVHLSQLFRPLSDPFFQVMLQIDQLGGTSGDQLFQVTPDGLAGMADFFSSSPSSAVSPKN